MTWRVARGAFPCVVLLFSLFSLPLPVCSQAWTPAKGELDLALSYQNLYVKDHVLSDGTRFYDGRIYSRGMIMDMTYGFTDRLALKVALPYIASRYDGPTPHQLPLDGGRYHSTFQDFNVDLRYRITKARFVVTPSVGVLVPSHQYEYFGHSAVGRDLREFRLGVNLGRRLDPIAPNAFVQAQYSYRFVEKVLDIPRKAGFAEVQLGYFVSRRLALIALGTWLDTYGGFTSKEWDALPDPTLDPVALGILTAEQFRHHDQIFHERLLNAGGGASFQVNPRVAIFGSAQTTLKGANGHAIASAITVGVNWTFQTRGDAKMARNRALGGSERLAQTRCVCAKK